MYLLEVCLFVAVSSFEKPHPLQKIARYRAESLALADSVHEILCAIIILSNLKSGALPDSELSNIARFAETLQKIYSFIEGQIGSGKVKRFFGQSRDAAALADCKTSLQFSIDVFIVRSRLEPMVKLHEIWSEESRRNHELLELIGGSGTISETSSSISVRS
ncbi:hypothetical protein C8F04DRAFT_1191137 [Mycena alexandri]|uniref:Uncharacterized protein n=1 Tax=Mycena alexandri TaxID=1745969 RepID=A0AAD6SFB6_9AGAR|nr:hypothetical protein C8F04DRAFT_1191137 [Mycena alexandri]